MNSKDTLRRIAEQRAARRGSQAARIASELALRAVERTEEFAAARCVALYWSLPGEIFTHDFVIRWSASKRIFLPVMQGDSLVLRLFTGPSQMRRARFGVQEPLSDESPEAGALGLIVVPGVGFDPYGNRLGHGKGFYDRLLARLDAPKAGVCFEDQMFDRLPTGPHDVPVDCVVCASARDAAVYRNGTAFDP